MAALAATKVGDRVPQGRYFEQTFKVGPTNAVALNATEWFVTGFSEVVAVVGAATLGTSTSSLNFVKNARGTGVAEGTNPGDVGIEASLGSTIAEVTVRGRP